MKRSWSNAVPTVTDGIRFGSKLEAKLYSVLKATLRPGDRLYVHPRMPLFALAATEKRTPMYFTPDLLIVRPGASWEVHEAKGRESRDWARGKAAFEATYGVTIHVTRRIR